MSIRDAVWKEIAEEVWLKYEMEIFNRLKIGEPIHGNRFYQLRKEMDRLGCDPDYAREYVAKQLKDIYEQLAEQGEMAG